MIFPQRHGVPRDQVDQLEKSKLCLINPERYFMLYLDIWTKKYIDDHIIYAIDVKDKGIEKFNMHLENFYVKRDDSRASGGFVDIKYKFLVEILV